MALRPLLSVAALSIMLIGCQKSADQAAAPVVPAAPAAAPQAVKAAPVILPGTRAEYTISEAPNGYLVARLDSKEAPVHVSATQLLRFKDISLSFDKNGNAGNAFRLYRAAFKRDPDHAGLGYWIGALDGGMTLSAVAAMMTDSAEFGTLYAPSLSSEELVRKFYQNTLGREGDPAGIQFWTEKLDSKAARRSDVLAAIASAPERPAEEPAGTRNGIAFTETGVSYLPFASANASPVVKLAPAK